MILFLMLVGFYSEAHSAAASSNVVDIPACVSQLEQELSEVEGSGQVECRVTVQSQQPNDDEVCQAIIEYTYVCLPSTIIGEGGACCPR